MIGFRSARRTYFRAEFRSAKHSPGRLPKAVLKHTSVTFRVVLSNAKHGSKHHPKSSTY